jgi:hypothetical protein
MLITDRFFEAQWHNTFSMVLSGSGIAIVENSAVL